MGAPTSEEELRRTAAAVIRNGGNRTHAAADLGITRSALQRRLHRCDQAGIEYTATTDPVDGIGEGELAGTSTLYKVDDGAGSVVLQWVKTRARPSSAALIEGLRDLFEEYGGRMDPIPPPPAAEADLLTLYPIADLHLGLYAWGEETGEDFNTEIARKVLAEAVSSLVARSPASETAVILNLGDYFHSDNSSNQTMRSRHALDVDTRYSRVARIGVQAMVDCIEIAAAKHERVIVRCQPGNHDDESAMWLGITLEAAFSRNPRIEVDTSPAPFWWHKHGRTMLGATHGHMARAKDMPGIMAALQARDWGESDFRYFHFGHIHHKTALPTTEYRGVTVESHQTLAAKDYWSASNGFSSNRGMCAITYHSRFGEQTRHTFSIPIGTRNEDWLKSLKSA